MLAPKRVKFRKRHTGKNRGMARSGTEVSFGDLQFHHFVGACRN